MMLRLMWEEDDDVEDDDVEDDGFGEEDWNASLCNRDARQHVTRAIPTEIYTKNGDQKFCELAQSKCTTAILYATKNFV